MIPSGDGGHASAPARLGRTRRLGEALCAGELRFLDSSAWLAWTGRQASAWGRAGGGPARGCAGRLAAGEPGHVPLDERGRLTCVRVGKLVRVRAAGARGNWHRHGASLGWRGCGPGQCVGVSVHGQERETRDQREDGAGVCAARGPETPQSPCAYSLMAADGTLPPPATSHMHSRIFRSSRASCSDHQSPVSTFSTSERHRPSLPVLVRPRPSSHAGAVKKQGGSERGVPHDANQRRISNLQFRSVAQPDSPSLRRTHVRPAGGCPVRDVIWIVKFVFRSQELAAALLR